MAVIDSYPESNFDAQQTLLGPAGPSRTTKIGQSFTTTDGVDLTSVQVYMYTLLSAPTGDITAELYAHTGSYGTTSVATGSPLAVSEAIDASTLTTSLPPSLYSLTFSTPYSLLPSTNYVIAVNYTGSSGNIRVGMDVSNPTHGGNVCTYTTAGWTARSTRDMIFYLHGAIAGSTFTPQVILF